MVPTLEAGSEAYLEAHQLLAAAYQATEQPELAARAEAVLAQYAPLDETWWQEIQALAKTQADGALLRRVVPVLGRLEATSVEYARMATWCLPTDGQPNRGDRDLIAASPQYQSQHLG